MDCKPNQIRFARSLCARAVQARAAERKPACVLAWAAFVLASKAGRARVLRRALTRCVTLLSTDIERVWHM